jgi:hypothetical protein
MQTTPSGLGVLNGGERLYGFAARLQEGFRAFGERAARRGEFVGSLREVVGCRDERLGRRGERVGRRGELVGRLIELVGDPSEWLERLGEWAEPTDNYVGRRNRWKAPGIRRDNRRALGDVQATRGAYPLMCRVNLEMFS